MGKDGDAPGLTCSRNRPLTAPGGHQRHAADIGDYGASVVPKLVLVGGGRMGEALLGGLLGSGWAQPTDVVVVEMLPERREVLASRFGGVRVQADVEAADGVVVAVKPGDVEAACVSIAAAGTSRVLSIAAGVPLARLERALGGSSAVPVVRAMPNMGALIGAGAAAISPGRAATDEDLTWAESVLGAVGTVVRVPEALLDAVTGLAGSGPAYVFMMAEALVDAGVLVGLPRLTSQALVQQTLLGAARLLVETGDSPETLRAAVTSPGGTTAAGLAALERAGLRSGLLDAVSAATVRAHELGTD